ncbi:MAG: pilus assembly protein PilP [Deltaproteobacteria bacterium]|nr:pilus assembly protein PilP [Deltaproteobacteria bacterium]
MMRRHSIAGIVGGVLIFWVAVGTGPVASRAADTKAAAPAPSAAVAGGAGTKAAAPAPSAAVAGGAGTKAAAPAPSASVAGGAGTKAVPAEVPAASVAGGAGTKPVPAEVPEATGYVYVPTGKSDPFKPFIETDLALKKKMEEELMKKAAAAKGLPISPLQQMEIDQLRLVGIAGGDQGRTAIVEDGVSKKHYPLFVGTYIGMNGGRIVSIRPDRVIIEERLPGQSKKVKKAKVKRITVMLHKEDEGKP